MCKSSRSIPARTLPFTLGLKTSSARGVTRARNLRYVALRPATDFFKIVATLMDHLLIGEHRFQQPSSKARHRLEWKLLSVKRHTELESRWKHRETLGLKLAFRSLVLTRKNFGKVSMQDSRVHLPSGFTSMVRLHFGHTEWSDGKPHA